MSVVLPLRKPAISEEEFLAWRDDPVTRWVVAGCRNAADKNKQAWMEASWHGGSADPLALATLRTRADAYMALAETPYSEWLKAHGEGE